MRTVNWDNRLLQSKRLQQSSQTKIEMNKIVLFDLELKTINWDSIDKSVSSQLVCSENSKKKKKIIVLTSTYSDNQIITCYYAKQLIRDDE